MSEPKIEILFDRPDRTYAPGEEISGVVRARVYEECPYLTLELCYEWRTHGRGNRDSGDWARIGLAHQERLIPGTTCSFPFRFRAPDGPPTYHGHYLNVDWYVTAQAEVPIALKLGPLQLGTWPKSWKTETEFLLRSDARLQVRSGSIVGPAGDQLYVASAIALTLGLLGAAVIAVSRPVPPRDTWLDALTLGLLFAICGAVTLAASVLVGRRRAIAALQLGRVAVMICAGQSGHSILTTIRFSPRSSIRLQEVTMELSVQERAVAGSGSTQETYTHTVFKGRAVERCFHRIHAKQDHRAELALKIPPDLPVTFHARDNDIKWTMTIQIVLDGWPNWTLKTPITVYR
jgi:hypothetical protein